MFGLGTPAPLGPTRSWFALRARNPRVPARPSVPRDHGLRCPAVNIYKGAYPALALRSALCNNTVSRVGNETWEENKAAGGGCRGGRRLRRVRCKRRRRRRADPGVAVRGLTRPVPMVPAVPGACWRQTSTLPRTLGRGVAGVHRARGAITQACAPGRVMGRSPGAFVPRANNRIWHYPQTWTYRSLLTVRREGTPPYVDILTKRIANHWVVPPLIRRPRGHLPRLRIKALT